MQRARALHDHHDLTRSSGQTASRHGIPTKPQCKPLDTHFFCQSRPPTNGSPEAHFLSGRLRPPTHRSPALFVRTQTQACEACVLASQLGKVLRASKRLMCRLRALLAACSTLWEAHSLQALSTTSIPRFGYSQRLATGSCPKRTSAAFPIVLRKHMEAGDMRRS